MNRAIHVGQLLKRVMVVTRDGASRPRTCTDWLIVVTRDTEGDATDGLHNLLSSLVAVHHSIILGPVLSIEKRTLSCYSLNSGANKQTDEAMPK